MRHPVYKIISVIIETTQSNSLAQRQRLLIESYGFLTRHLSVLSMNVDKRATQ